MFTPTRKPRPSWPTGVKIRVGEMQPAERMFARDILGVGLGSERPTRPARRRPCSEGRGSESPSPQGAPSLRQGGLEPPAPRDEPPTPPAPGGSGALPQA